MKKISLKSVKTFLSRDEMRTISGGTVSEGSGSWCMCNDGNERSMPNCSWCGAFCYGQGWICTG